MRCAVKWRWPPVKLIKKRDKAANTVFLRETDKTSVIYVLFWVKEGVSVGFVGLKCTLSLRWP